jgi:hypothetical protein
MELVAELERALATVCTAGPAEVRENGEWLAALGGLQYEVRSQGDAALLHLWGARQSLVRRVVRVAEQSPGRVVLDVSRFGRARHAKLEFLVNGVAHEDRRWGREQFRTRLHRLLTGSPTKSLILWPPARICIIPFQVRTRAASCIAVRMPMPC